FGPLTYSLAAAGDTVHASVQEPSRARPGSVQLRLRLPRGRKIAALTLDGQAWHAYDRRTGTTRLPVTGDTIDLVAQVASGYAPSRVVRGMAVTLLALLALGATSDLSASAAGRQVRIWRVVYRAHNGAARDAFVVLPSWYGPNNDPPIPLVISPHGRGVTA